MLLPCTYTGQLVLAVACWFFWCMEMCSNDVISSMPVVVEDVLLWEQGMHEGGLDMIDNRIVIILYNIMRVHIVIRFPRFSHSLPLLKSLHWLPIRYRITFKICTITYQALSSGQPACLHSLTSLLIPARWPRPL